jgi:hypothetical protein
MLKFLPLNKIRGFFMSFLSAAAASSTPVTALSLCDSLTTTELEAFEAKLKGSGVSSMGFLGTDTLREVSVYDKAELAKINITYKQIADKLTSLICRLIRLHNLDKDQSTHVTHKRFSLENKFILVMSSYYRGLQSCPFQEHREEYCDNSFSCYNFVLTNIRQNRSINFGGLLPHLLGEHEFAEGRGAPYRLDPKDAAQVLELEPDVDYAYTKTIEKTWRLKSELDLSPSSFFSGLESRKTYAEKIVESSDKGAVCLFIKDLFDPGLMEMHVFAQPSAVCDFDTTFDETTYPEAFRFYLSPSYRLRHMVFIQQKNTQAVLDRDDKVLPKASSPLGHARLGGVRILGIRSADGTIIPVNDLEHSGSMASVVAEARSGGASSAAAAVGGSSTAAAAASGGGGGGARADATVEEAKPSLKPAGDE